MSRSSLTEETPATPGWVDGRVRALFATLGEGATPIGQAYADCLANVRGGTDVDAGHDGCRRAALASLEGVVPDVAAFDRDLQALEAEISEST